MRRTIKIMTGFLLVLSLSACADRVEQLKIYQAITDPFHHNKVPPGPL